MYSGSAQGVVERVINVRYYYYYYLKFNKKKLAAKALKLKIEILYKER